MDTDSEYEEEIDTKSEYEELNTKSQFEELVTESKYGEVDKNIKNSAVEQNKVKSDSDVKVMIESEHQSHIGTNKGTQETAVSVRETNKVVSSISGEEIHKRTSPNPLQLDNSLSEVKCWVARETNIFCPECGCELDVTRPLSKHMKTHQRVEGRYLCIHCQKWKKKIFFRSDQILNHMQIGHGLCFLPDLYIEHSPKRDLIICPACPKGWGKNMVGWDNLETHFVKVHTHCPDKFKLICKGCGSISVHLKDVHKHENCSLSTSNRVGR